MKVNGISISDGNMKIGATPSFSVMPVRTCSDGVPCVHNCYACRMTKRYPNVKAAYEANTAAVLDNVEKVMETIQGYLIMTGAIRFRWNVAGDFFTDAYLLAAIELVRVCRGVQFLAYTKQYDRVNRILERVNLPDNFTLVLSAWDRLIPENPHNLPIAWYQDGQCNVPTGFTCPGKCCVCGFRCWNMKRGDNVIFWKH